ncbi:MAG: hypothetical protein H6Q54_1494 [Deltaproteobacteria bacterium]|jgi:hypothetical protein|nr:hypothetical protein [Deltaproteobacteria bacterium]
MKKASLIFAICTVLLMYTAPPVASQEGIIGTWRLVSMTYRDQSTGKEVDLWGKGPIGFLTYTPGGRMSAVIAAASRKITAESADQASVEEQAMLFRSCFAYAGTYSLTDTGVIHHVKVASDPTWIGKDQTRFVHFEGKRLVISGPPLQPVSDPNPKVLQLVWERVE